MMKMMLSEIIIKRGLFFKKIIQKKTLIEKSQV